MADNTTPQAILVANQKVRPACDRILQTYNFMKALQAEYNAQNWTLLFPAADPTGEVKDGAATDGRAIAQNQDINAVFTALGAFLTFMEATSNQRLNQFLKVAVNPER